MNPSITIRNAGRPLDKWYVGFLSLFWLVWTLGAAWATVSALTDFHFFWILWLPFAFLGVYLPPYIILSFRKPQKFEATSECLIVHRTGIPFKQVVKIPREQVIKLYFGRYDDGNGEAARTLNIFSENSFWTRRIMISTLSHSNEKRKIFQQLRTFLTENGFALEIVDHHPNSNSPKWKSPSPNRKTKASGPPDLSFQKSAETGSQPDHCKINCS